MRAAAVVLVYVLGIAVVLTYSRGGLLAAVFALVAYLALARERVEGIAALGIAVLAALPALVWGLTQPGVADDFQSNAVRVEDGAWFGLIVFLGALAAFGVAWWAAPRRVSERTGRLVVRGALVVLVAFALFGAVVAVRGGEDVVQQGPSRQLSTGSNNRTKWWGEAWDAFAGQPIIGVGAGSFEYVHRRLRKNKIDVTEPHDLPLQFAAETGLVGLALFAGAMGAALVGLWRRRDDAAALALGLALPTYLFHGLLDYDWDFLAVTAPVLFATGVLLADGRPERRVTAQPLWAVVAVLAATIAALLAGRSAPGRETCRGGLRGDRPERHGGGGRQGAGGALLEPAVHRAALCRGCGRGGPWPGRACSAVVRGRRRGAAAERARLVRARLLRASGAGCPPGCAARSRAVARSRPAGAGGDRPHLAFLHGSGPRATSDSPVLTMRTG